MGDREKCVRERKVREGEREKNRKQEEERGTGKAVDRETSVIAKMCVCVKERESKRGGGWEGDSCLTLRSLQQIPKGIRAPFTSSIFSLFLWRTSYFLMISAPAAVAIVFSLRSV